MKKLFEIDENEKRRILEMHEKATKNLYLNEQGTPAPTSPPAQPQNTTGGQISGTDTIDKVKDATSLNIFMNWGYDVTNPQAKTSPDDSKLTNMFMASRLNFKNITNNDDMREKDGTTEGKRAAEAIRKVYEDLKYIAQNYTLTELCSSPIPIKGNLGFPPEVEPIQVLVIAKNRAGDLGWCGAKKTKSEKNKPASPQNKAKF